MNANDSRNQQYHLSQLPLYLALIEKRPFLQVVRLSVFLF